MEAKNFLSELNSAELKSNRFDDIEWRTSTNPINYLSAVDIMETRVNAIHKQKAREMIWLLEHQPVYTAGTSAKPKDLLIAEKFSVHKTGRGGQYTYHGPGQRVVYVMLDLKKREPDLKRYVHKLERWLISALAEFDIVGKQHDGRVGIWVLDKQNNEKKIAAIGIRVRRWISYHGISINLNPDLTHYNGIIPCGISDYGVTSLHQLGIKVNMKELDLALNQTFYKLF